MPVKQIKKTVRQLGEHQDHSVTIKTTQWS